MRQKLESSLIAVGATLAVIVFGLAGQGASAREAAQRPAWIRKLIAHLEAAPVANPPASIVRYRHEGKAFYYLPPRCCDIPGVIYDSQGRVVCHPDGGFSGRGDGRCPPGFRNSSGGKVIWRDPRKYP